MRFLTLALTTILAMTMFPFTAQAKDNHALLLAGGAGGWLNVTRPVTADDMKGRVLLLDFWTYGCINCMQVIPDLEYLEHKFGDKLLVIGVHSAKFSGESGNARIESAARRFGLKHPVINDSDFAIWKSFGVRAWPSLILLGPDGKEIARYSGEGHRAELERAIEKATKTLTASSSLSGLIADDTNKAPLSFPARLAYGNDQLWIADSGHNRILGIDPATGEIKTTIAATPAFNNPRGMTLVGHTLYIADTGNHLLRAADIETGNVTTLAGTGERGHRLRDGKAVTAVDSALASPWDVELMADGNTLAIANAGTHQIFGYDIKAKTLHLLAGNGYEAIDDGEAARAALAQPSGLSRAPDGTLFFADAESSSLRALTPNGDVKTLIGTGLFDFGHKDGRYPQAQLQHAQGLFAEKSRILIADTYNNAIRIYDRNSGELTTVKLTDGALAEPGDILRVGETLYVADTNHHALKKIDLATGETKEIPLKTAP